MSIKIGAFIEVPDIKEYDKKIVKICTNTDCFKLEKETSANWCPACGKYIILVEKKEQVDRKYFWLQESIKIEDDTFDIVQGETSSYLFSNQHDSTVIHRVEDIEGRLPLALATDFARDAKKEFKRKYASEITKLEAFYKRRFDVHFGIIKDYL